MDETTARTAAILALARACAVDDWRGPTLDYDEALTAFTALGVTETELGIVAVMAATTLDDPSLVHWARHAQPEPAWTHHPQTDSTDGVCAAGGTP